MPKGKKTEQEKKLLAIESELRKLTRSLSTIGKTVEKLKGLIEEVSNAR